MTTKSVRECFEKGLVSLRDEYSHANYPTDLTTKEWERLMSFFPPASGRGRPRKWTLWQILNAILYVTRTGCQWRMLPRGLSAMADRVWLLLALDRRAGCGHALNTVLVKTARQQAGRDPQPSAADYRQSECEDLRRRRSPRSGCPQANARAASATLSSTCWDCCSPWSCIVPAFLMARAASWYSQRLFTQHQTQRP